MKRRDAFRLIPLTFAGIGSLARYAAAIENSNRSIQSGEHIPPALMYQKNILGMLEWVRKNQSEKILESSYAIARTIRNGGKFFL